MNPRKLLVSAALLVGFGAAAPASAAIVYVQYTGTVSEGYDTTGIFGTAGSFQAGTAYVANYTFDTTLGAFNFTSATTNYALGGESLLLSSSPALSASITINGVTVGVSGNWQGQIFGFNNGTSSQSTHDAQERVVSEEDVYFAQVYNAVFAVTNGIPASITDPYSYSVGGDDGFDGWIQIQNYNSPTDTYTVDTFAYLAPNQISVSLTAPTAPVPEPETYALLLAGLGLLGFAARRRKLKEAAAA